MEPKDVDLGTKAWNSGVGVDVGTLQNSVQLSLLLSFYTLLYCGLYRVESAALCYARLYAMLDSIEKRRLRREREREKRESASAS